jgi:WD40 repeat protein
MRVIKLRGVKRINGLHYAPDGRLLVVSGVEMSSASDCVWVDTHAGAETKRVGLPGGCYSVSSDVSKIAISDSNLFDGEAGSFLVLCDLASASQVTVLHPTDAPGAVAFHGLAFGPTGKRLAVSYSLANEDYYHFAILPVSGRGKRLEHDEDDFPSGIIAFSPNEESLATSGGPSQRRTVFFLDSRTYEYLNEYEPPSAPTRQLLYSPSGEELAVVNGLNVCLVPEASEEPRLSLAHLNQVNCVAFSPCGRQLLSACQDKLVRVWDVKTGVLLRSYDWKVGAVTALAFAPDGLTVAAGGTRGQVVIWDWA